jgi:hypothetical protein
MRQGVVITGLLVVVGLGTVVFADGGWDGIRRDVSALSTVEMPTLFAAAPPARKAQQSEAVQETLAFARDMARGASKTYLRATDEELVFVDGEKAEAQAAASAGSGLVPVRPVDGGDAIRAVEVQAEAAADVATAATAAIAGPTRDYGAAFNRYVLANDPANAEARYAIGHDLLAAKEPQAAEGARFLRGAAELGHARAALELAGLYVEGTGVDRDYVRAFMWYAIAQRGEIEPAAKEMAADRLSRLGRAMTSEEIVAAEALIRDWQPTRIETRPDVETITSAVGN